MTRRADLPEVNGQLYDQFRRITGQSNRFLFAHWLASKAREVGYGRGSELLAKLEQQPGNSETLGGL